MSLTIPRKAVQKLEQTCITSHSILLYQNFGVQGAIQTFDIVWLAALRLLKQALDW
jgi:hypothetical protein